MPSEVATATAPKAETIAPMVGMPNVTQLCLPRALKRTRRAAAISAQTRVRTNARPSDPRLVID